MVHRGYSTGFLLGAEPQHNFSGKLQGGKMEFVGEILEEGIGGEPVCTKVHNAIYLDDRIEAVTPKRNILIKNQKNI